MKTTISLTGLPLLRETDPILSPAFAAAQRSADWVELRIQRAGGRTRILLTSRLRAEQYAFLRPDGVLYQPTEPPPAARTLVLLAREARTSLSPGQGAPALSCVLSEVGRDNACRRYLWAAMAGLADGAGLSLFLRRRTEALPLRLSARLKASPSPAAAALCQAQEHYEMVGCLYGASADIAALAPEIRAAFPGLGFSVTDPQPADADALMAAADPLATRFLPWEAEVLTALTALPGGPELNRDTIPGRTPVPPAGQGLQLGVSVQGTPVCLPWRRLCCHTVLAGPPGSGKTNSLFGLCRQLRDADIPVLAIEPAKSEFHHLGKTLALDVWRPTAGGYVLDPFAVPEGVSLAEYRSTLLAMLESCFHLEGPLVELFGTTLTRCFARCGWRDGDTPESPGTEAFGLHEFLLEFNQLLGENGYSARAKADIGEAGRVRLQRLFTENAAVFDTVRSIPVTALVQGFHLIQLNALTSTASKQIFMALLLFSLGAYLKLRFPHAVGEKPRLVILVDESHNLFAGAEGDSPFARDFQNLLLELRSVGVAFLLADQSLDALPRVVSDTPANKIFLSGARSSGILPYAGELGLDDAALRELWQLGPGQGLYADSMAPRAVYFRAPNVIDACHLETGCPARNRWLDAHPRYTVECFRECRDCAARGRCTQAGKASAALAAQRGILTLGSRLSSALADGTAEGKAALGQCLALLRTEVEALPETERTCAVLQFARLFNRRGGPQIDPKKLSALLLGAVREKGGPTHERI